MGAHAAPIFLPATFIGTNRTTARLAPRNLQYAWLHILLGDRHALVSRIQRVPRESEYESKDIEAALHLSVWARAIRRDWVHARGAWG
jgi:hypothetical protein